MKRPGRITMRFFYKTYDQRFIFVLLGFRKKAKEMIAIKDNNKGSQLLMSAQSPELNQKSPGSSGT